MTAAVDDTSDELIEQPPQGPGHRLRAARAASGIEMDKLAAQLHLKPDQVEALEQDRYDGFAARVFVRGYLRNYARLVNLPVDEVLAAFDAVCPDPDQPRKLRRVGSHRPQVGSGHGLVRMVSWALLLGMVALFLVWWAGYLEINGGDAGSAGEPGVETGAAEVEPGLLLQPLGTSPDGAAPERPDPASPEEQAAPAGEIQPPTVPAAPASVEDAEASLDVDQDVASPVLSAAPEDSPAEALGPQFVLSLSDTCWVQIRDSSGEYKLIGNLAAGTRHVLGGEPPYKVLLGNAAAAELTIDGQPVDLAPHTRAQVARLTLTADTR